MKKTKLVIFVLASLFMTTAFGVLAVPSHDVKAKAKYQYYETTLNPSEYVYYYDSSKKNKQGIAYDASIKGNKFKISGALTKGSRLNDTSKKVKFMGEKTRKFKITKRTKYYIAGGEDSMQRISKAKCARYLRKGSKGLLSFGITLKVRAEKVVEARLYS